MGTLLSCMQTTGADALIKVQHQQQHADDVANDEWQLPHALDTDLGLKHTFHPLLCAYY
jgi:hypothetical protein